jgi:glycosidase
VGVDGFRLDAARHLIEEDRKQADTNSTHEWWANFRTFYKQINPDAMTVGEIWTSNYSVVDYVEGDELDMAFNFDLASQIMRNTESRSATNLGAVIQSSYKLFEPGTYATFLTNHDQDRVMSEFFEDEDKAKLAANVLLTVPGTPFIYYGEEIGMTGRKPDEKIRTPMLWSAEANAGFSSTFPWESINSNYLDTNVEVESENPLSLLSHYRTLIRLRNEHAALRVGDYLWVRSDNPSVLSFLRTSEKEQILVLINMSDENVSGYNLSLSQGPLSGSYHVFPILGEGEFIDLETNQQGGFDAYQPSIDLPANGVMILQLRER